MFLQYSQYVLHRVCGILCISLGLYIPFKGPIDQPSFERSFADWKAVTYELNKAAAEVAKRATAEAT